MCKTYGCKPSIDLFRGFFNLCRAGKWLTFTKRSEKHVPNLLPKVITRIEGWHEKFFYVQDSIIPAKYSQLLSEQNKLDLKSFKDKLPPNIEETYVPASWNFIYTEDDDDLLFLPKEPSPGLDTGFPSISVNTKPLKANKELMVHPAKVMADSGESPKPELFIVHPGSVAARIKDRKCKTRGGSSRPHVKRKLAPGSLISRATRTKTSSLKEDVSFLTVSDDDEVLSDVLELKDATACHLKISAITPLAWKNHLDNHMDLELLDLHDRYYARHAVVDNAVNRRSRELLAKEEEYEGLRVKCEAAMTEFKKNPTVVVLREKIFALSIEVTSLESEKARLEAVEVSLRKEVEEVKQDNREVVSKVADMKDPFDLSNVKDYCSSYKKDHTQASNNLATVTFLWLDEFVVDPSTPIEALVLQKPPTLQRPASSRTQVPLPFS
ncbi:hypothetical protein Tco_0175420 [Tanacetum coccineum]